MKQSAPRPEPQSRSLGLRVVIGQNSWNRVAFCADWMPSVSDWGFIWPWFAESSWGAAELICGAALGRADVMLPGLPWSFGALGVSRGPRTFSWEFQNSVEQYRHSMYLTVYFNDQAGDTESRERGVFTDLFPYVRWTRALCGMLLWQWLQEAPEGRVTHL